MLKYKIEDEDDEVLAFNEIPHHVYIRNQQNISKLIQLRQNALGIGTNKLKRRLNKLALTDINAKIIRILLEIEDVSTQAKNTSYKYKQKKYDIKDKLIRELCDIYPKTEYKFGYGSSDVAITSSIFYFHLPDGKQVSFHSNMNDMRDIPKYNEEWDGQVNSTFGKIIDYIRKNYKEIYEKKDGKK
jgi:N-acetyl-anhydromuramyl-L-alanine amidase AmpD